FRRVLFRFGGEQLWRRRVRAREDDPAGVGERGLAVAGADDAEHAHAVADGRLAVRDADDADRGRRVDDVHARVAERRQGVEDDPLDEDLLADGPGTRLGDGEAGVADRDPDLGAAVRADADVGRV